MRAGRKPYAGLTRTVAPAKRPCPPCCSYPKLRRECCNVEHARAQPSLSPVLIALFKGVVYEDQNENLWQALLHLQPRVRDQVSVFGLELVLDEAEGYAYLRQRPTGPEETELP